MERLEEIRALIAAPVEPAKRPERLRSILALTTPGEKREYHRLERLRSYGIVPLVYAKNGPIAHEVLLFAHPISPRVTIWPDAEMNSISSEGARKVELGTPELVRPEDVIAWSKEEEGALLT